MENKEKDGEWSGRVIAKFNMNESIYDSSPSTDPATSHASHIWLCWFTLINVLPNCTSQSKFTRFIYLFIFILGTPAPPDRFQPVWAPNLRVFHEKFNTLLLGRVFFFIFFFKASVNSFENPDPFKLLCALTTMTPLKKMVGGEKQSQSQWVSDDWQVRRPGRPLRSRGGRVVWINT